MLAAANLPCWLEVDLEALKYNYELIRERIGPQVKLLGVVKADAYGHGLVPISLFLEKLGVEMLGVTTAEEGLILRTAGVRVPILVFRPFFPEELALYVEHDLTATIADLAAVLQVEKWFAEHEGKLKVHLKVETGLGRYGLWPKEVVPAAQRLLQIPEVNIEGVYSHLASAMQKNKSYAKRQFKLFGQACQALEEIGLKNFIRHIANSAAVLDLPEMYLEMVRVGTLLYGQYPEPRQRKIVELKETGTFKAKVVYIRDLPRGYTVGYQRAFKTRRTTPVAVLPVGLKDGVEVAPLLKPANLLDFMKGVLKLFLSYRGWLRFSPPVFFPGGVGRIIGKVGMQLTMVEISKVEAVQVGTIAELPLRKTMVAAGIPRFYKANKR